MWKDRRMDQRERQDGDGQTGRWVRESDRMLTDRRTAVAGTLGDDSRVKQGEGQPDRQTVSGQQTAVGQEWADGD